MVWHRLPHLSDDILGDRDRRLEGSAEDRARTQDQLGEREKRSGAHVRRGNMPLMSPCPLCTGTRARKTPLNRVRADSFMFSGLGNGTVPFPGVL
jgi:hypothetical protein